ncbi:MAG: aspartate--tRNA(Asn) ligase, partial [Candidatus Nealsonbacteria bacterium]|nr:aspartate--tRNA(Asn) ligase [Candidatus Nealsonbacteria bacterium]
GWINSRRDHGKIVFFDLRDFSGILQIVSKPEIAEGVGLEYAVEIEGTIQKRPVKMINPEIETGSVELSAKSIKILARAQVLPFDIRDLKATLPTLLDYRPITLRNEKVRAIFKIREGVINSFRNTLKTLGFYEFEAPTIVPANAEGGAAVFHIDYYDKDAYLAQSPQLYKQILVGALERVFTVTNILRAEPSITTRHLSESTSLDAEMGFIDSWQDLMDACETIIKNIVLNIQKNYKNELRVLKAEIPQIGEKIPRIKMREAQGIIFERTKRDNRQEPDLEPGDEKEICNFAKEKYNSDFVFITHYPTKKRPFYTYPDPENENYTLSFDILFKGLEIASGGQRINDYEKLRENIKKWGNNPKDFDFYLQAFKYGMPPEGGFAFGAERIVKQFLNLENLREASFFPRDMERIDLRLSLTEEKNKIKGKKTKKEKK